jgi:phospholipase/carboxylesterase
MPSTELPHEAHVTIKAIESTLFHIIEAPRTTTASLHPTLILLHGRGADEEDLLGLSSHLDKRLLILSVRAPYPFEYSGGFTWYDIDEMGTPDPAMFKSSYDKLSSFISDALAHYPIDKKQLYLLGFSMGTVMSYALALTQPGLFSGIVANSGYVAEGTRLTYQWDQLSNIEFFVSHGTQDPVIPVQIARKAKGFLEAAHARFDYKEYPVGHQISEESLQDISIWLTQRLDTTS